MFLTLHQSYMLAHAGTNNVGIKGDTTYWTHVSCSDRLFQQKLFNKQIKSLPFFT